MDYESNISINMNDSFISEECRKKLIPNYVLVVTSTSAVLSIIGGFFIIYSYFKIPAIRNFARKMLLALTVADLLTATGNLAGTLRYVVLSPQWTCTLHKTEKNDAFCIVQSFVTTFSSMASFFWTTIIVAHIFLAVVYRFQNMNRRRMLVTYHVLSWGIPGVITVIAASLQILGEDYTIATSCWCWVRSNLADDIQITWMFVSGKLWELVCYLSTVSLYVLLKAVVWLQRRRRTPISDLYGVSDFRSEDINFMYIFLVLYVLRIWGTVRFFLAINQKHLDSVHLTTARSYLLLLQGIGDSGQAFWNCILFCVCDKTVRRQLCRRRYVQLLDEDSISVQE